MSGSSISAERVLVEHAQLEVRGPLRVPDARSFACDILAALEQRLDALLPVRENELFLPRLDLVLRVHTNGAPASAAIGRALADLIAGEARDAGLCLPEGAAELHEMAAQRRSGAREDRPYSALPDQSWSIERLGWMARRNDWVEFACWVTPERALAILGVIFAEFVTFVPEAAPRSGGTIDPARLVARALRAAVARPGEASPDTWPRSVLVVLAVAWTARLGACLVRESRAWRDAVLSVLEEQRPSVFSAPLVRELARESAVPGGTGGVLAAAAALPGHAAAESSPNSAIIAQDAGAFEQPDSRATRMAGLAFLLLVLEDLGWRAAVDAVRGAGSIGLVDVLRRVLELAGVGAELDDPAPWLLAGLQGPPEADDLTDEAAAWSRERCTAMARAVDREASTYPGAVDAWAGAALEELCARLPEPYSMGTVGTAIIQVSGWLRRDAQAVSVVMPFIEAYETLLRAGLLSDLSQVSWLEGRALRFVFEGGA